MCSNSLLNLSLVPAAAWLEYVNVLRHTKIEIQCIWLTSNTAKFTDQLELT